MSCNSKCVKHVLGFRKGSYFQNPKNSFKHLKLHTQLFNYKISMK